MHPNTSRAPSAAQRMLVVHRTGAGKTCTMIRIADNFFKDKRPKLLVFPTPAVCTNFYTELLNAKFPNRYAEYVQRDKPVGTVRKGLELAGALRCGRVLEEYLEDEERPSAPLRAFSYTQAGGTQSCGDGSAINAVFKCPAGYAGRWNYGPGEVNPCDGYEEFHTERADEEYNGNPFSNKVLQ